MEDTGKRICHGQRQRERSCMLSQLPEEIAHKIFSLLSTEDLIRLSLSSKRSMELWPSIPSVTFDGLRCDHSLKRRALINYFDKVMIRRQTSPAPGAPMRRFCLRWYVADDIHREESRLHSWLAVAAKYKITDLDVELEIDHKKREFASPLPFCIFRCESLTNLSLNLPAIVKVSSLVGLVNLQSLNLGSMVIDEGKDGEECCLGRWISSLKSLKMLWLSQIDGIEKVEIQNCWLETLLIDSLMRRDRNGNPLGFTRLSHINISCQKLVTAEFRWRWRSNSFSGKSMRIEAPSLRYLLWAGSSPDTSCLHNLMHKFRGLSLQFSPVHATHIVKLFEDFSGVCTNFAFSQLFDEMMILRFKDVKNTVRSFNIDTLCLRIRSLDDDLVPPLVHRFKEIPKLKRLSIQVCPCQAVPFSNATGQFSKEYWESQNLEFVQQLEEVTIELGIVNGLNELTLVEYLLQHAHKLNKMVIRHSSPLPLNVRTILDECTLVVQEVRPLRFF